MEEIEEHTVVVTRASKPVAAPVAAPIAAPAGAIVQQHQMSRQPFPYPISYAALPVAYAVPNHPVRVHAPTPAVQVASASSTKSIKARPGKTPTVKTSTAVAASTKAKKEEPAPAAGPSHKAWTGRTRKQVDEDNIAIAKAEGVYNFTDFVPRGQPDQLFWVQEVDGSQTLRSFQSIEGGYIGQGKWKTDKRHGNAYFALFKEDKEKE